MVSEPENAVRCKFKFPAHQTRMNTEYYNSSKSSSLSLYFMMFRLILLPGAHVTKSCDVDKLVIDCKAVASWCREWKP